MKGKQTFVDALNYRPLHLRRLTRTELLFHTALGFVALTMITSAWMLAQFSDSARASTPSTIVSISRGNANSCLVDNNHNAYCWGNASLYPVNGDGTYTQRNTPTLVSGGYSWASISVGLNHVCGLTTTNVGYCWGDNADGELGNNSTSPSSTPALINGGYSWSTISAGANTTCGVTTTNVGYCWGYNNTGQLGDTTLTTRLVPTAVNGSLSFASIKVGPGSGYAGNGATVCGLTTGNAAYCWGYNASGQVGDNTLVTRKTPTAVNGGYAFSTVQAGADFSCGIVSTSSTVYCWGLNTEGQVGDGTVTLRKVPTQTSGAISVTSLSVGGEHACALNAGGTAYCWGSGDSGAQGDGLNMAHSTPTSTMPGRTWNVLTTGNSGTCTLDATPQLFCWGLNANGQNGDGTTTTHYIPRAANIGPIRYGFQATDGSVNETSGTFTATVERMGSPSGAVSVNYATSDNTAIAGTDYTSTSGTLNFADGVTTATINMAITNNALSNGARKFSVTLSAPSSGTSLDTQTTMNVSILDDETAKMLTTRGSGTNCYITSSAGGDAYCWGDNSNGQVGDGTTTNRTTPTLVSGGYKWTSISAQTNAVCAVRADNQWVYCWGGNFDGELGTADTMSHNSPQLTAGDISIAQLDSGYDHSCAVSTTGGGYCWGLQSSTYPAIGDGSGVSRSIPWGISGGYTWAQLTASSDMNAYDDENSCGITTTGAAYCWGINSYGQLGDGSTATRSYPTAITGGPFSAISTGGDFTCAIKTSTSLPYCWGVNSSGQLGDNTTTNRTSPTLVSGGIAMSSIDSAGEHTCGLSSGIAYCWGGGDTGAQGDGLNQTHLTPTSTMPSKTWAFLAGGYRGSCGATTSGVLYCWGIAEFSQNGDGSTLTYFFPRPVNIGASRYDFVYAGGAVNENSGTYTATVERLGSSSGAVSVDYATADGTAVAGSDYSANSGTLNFANNVTSATITINITNNAITNGARNFAISLSNPSSGTSIEQQSTNTVTILDDESAKPVVARGSATTCYITSNAGGDAYCWGYNGEGQVGDGTTTNRTTPTLVSGGYKWTSISVGTDAVCAIRVENQQLYCWGNGYYGQLGDGEVLFAQATTPAIALGAVSYKQVVSGSQRTCAIAISGIGFCWGTSSSTLALLGDGVTTARPVPGAVSGGYTFSQISTSPSQSTSSSYYATTCGVTTTNALYCWGANPYGQIGDNTTANRALPTAISGTYNAVSVGDDQTCAIKVSDGYTYCWGLNTDGAVGDGTLTNRKVPTVTAGSVTLSSLSAGGTFSCGLNTGGNLYCWGSPSNGAQGDTNTAHLAPTSTTSRTWSMISASETGSCGVTTTTNLIYCWGDNTYGNNGDGSTLARFTPRAVSTGAPRFGLTTTASSANEMNGTVAISVERLGTTSGTVSVDYATSNGTAIAGTDYTAKSGTLTFSNGVSNGTINVTLNDDVLMNGTRTFALTLSNPSTGTSIDGTSVITVSILDDDSARPVVTVGSSTSCYITSNAGGNGYCWGYNNNGQIGDGTTTNHSTPTAISGGYQWLQLSTGSYATCGIRAVTMQLYCWGTSFPYGTLGTGSLWSTSSTPTLVAGGLAWTSVDVGYGTACGVTVDNVGYCWGDNTSGQIGDGTTNARYAPSGLTGNWTQLSAGGASGSTVCGIKTTTNSAYCWGNNSSGQIGNNTTVSASTPTAISGALTLASITTGDSSTCAETLTAATYCWGDNTYGQVGDATNTQRKIPTAVSAAYSSVINGEYHACGLNASGIAYCWGDDTYGEIGDAQSGAGIKVNTPTLVGGSITFRQLDAGAYETCGVSTGNVIYCWGYNNYGQIGDTTTTMRTAPATGAFTPSVSISIGNASITEGNSGTATLNVPLTLSGTTSAAVVVKYSTTDVTATAGVDYTSATNAVANIPAGSTTANIAVAVSGDAVYEPDETFTVTLSQVSYNSRWSTTQGTGTILNDDVQPPPTLTFSLSGVTSGTTCNGITTTATSTATGFALYPSASAASSTALSASVTTNAGNGYSLYAKFLATPASGSHTLAAHSGTNTNPVAAFPTGTEAFGYTTDDTTLSNTGAGISRFAGPKWAGLNTTDAEIAGATSQGTETSCQVYQVNQSTTSPAGRYAGTIIYTVVPHF